MSVLQPYNEFRAHFITSVVSFSKRLELDCFSTIFKKGIVASSPLPSFSQKRQKRRTAACTVAIKMAGIDKILDVFSDCSGNISSH